jgi:hypothetical protein
MQTGNVLLVLRLHGYKTNMGTLSGFCYCKDIVVVIFIDPHKGRDMLGGNELGIMA